MTLQNSYMNPQIQSDKFYGNVSLLIPNKE